MWGGIKPWILRLAIGWAMLTAHQGFHGSEQTGKQTRILFFLLSQHLFHGLALRWHGKAGWTVVVNYRQTGTDAVVARLAFAGITQRTNDTDVAGVIGVVGLHRT